MVRQILFRVIYADENADRDTVHNALISQMTWKPALLRNHMRHRIKSVAYPAVAPHKGKNVQGILVSGLTDGDIRRLDRFEGDQYDRKVLGVELLGEDGVFGTGGNVEAEVYMWNYKYEGLRRGEWSIEEFREVHLSKWVGEAGEHEYQDIETDYAVAAVSDVPAKDGGDKSKAQKESGAKTDAADVEDDDMDAAV
ncbi:BtrG-like protein [Glarea lozoyensis ATCC 20868]|uniref:Putative gamma-glutamylcyclotransferase n=2 Tax=Glarea lozoyensis TaxID=101852 RepID=S3CEC5_GLAL2|nr:BtrG-like protein [Glarea lozoyensis ATCC 20868]EHL01519.1 putative AIG2-like protein [Glarea lozoyensis 74030]EPE24812.1 BtrG-like protein [Glarea lozoyensis ATCC 20868]